MHARARRHEQTQLPIKSSAAHMCRCSNYFRSSVCCLLATMHVHICKTKCAAVTRSERQVAPQACSTVCIGVDSYSQLNTPTEPELQYMATVTTHSFGVHSIFAISFCIKICISHFHVTSPPWIQTALMLRSSPRFTNFSNLSNMLSVGKTSKDSP